MKKVSKEKASKLCAETIWDQDSEWNFLEEQIREEGTQFEIENSTLFSASIVLDEEENFLSVVYEKMEEFNICRIFKVCKDCYDFITSEDGSVEDVFIHYYGEEEGHIRFLDVKTCVENIEKGGNFWQEVPELLNSFSSHNCECCNTHLAGERFFMVFLGKKNEV